MTCLRCWKQLKDHSKWYCEDCAKLLQEEEKSISDACAKISINIVDKCKSCKKDFCSCHARKRVYFKDVYEHNDDIPRDLVLWCSDWEER
jgi:hypothetical protein